MYAITCHGMFVTSPDNYATDRRSAMLFETVEAAETIAGIFQDRAKQPVEIVEVDTRVVCGKIKNVVKAL